MEQSLLAFCLLSSSLFSGLCFSYCLPCNYIKTITVCFADELFRCLGGVLFSLYSTRFNRVGQRSQKHFLFRAPHDPSHSLSCSGWCWMSSDITLTSEWAPVAVQQVMDLITVRCLPMSAKQGKKTLLNLRSLMQCDLAKCRRRQKQAEWPLSKDCFLVCVFLKM